MCDCSLLAALLCSLLSKESRDVVFPEVIISVSLECRAESLAVTLTTDQPFTGRLFSQAGGSQCGTRGTGRRETALVVGLDQGSVQRCGVERREGVVSTVIVVQHHPVIQRRGDKAVQVLCYFQATNKVVTNSYDIIAKYLMKTSLASPHLTVSITALLMEDLPSLLPPSSTGPRRLLQ